MFKNFKKLERLAIVIFPFVEELDFVGVFEVLARTRIMHERGLIDIEKPLEVDILAFQDEIKCANGLIIKPHKVSTDLTDYDMVIVPGGQGVLELRRNKAFLNALKNYAENHIVGSVCTGTLVLAETGVLNGKRATTHHSRISELEKYCQVVNERVVVDGNVITAGGVSCSLDLGLKILELRYGKEVPEKMVEALEIPCFSSH